MKLKKLTFFKKILSICAVSVCASCFFSSTSFSSYSSDKFFNYVLNSSGETVGGWLNIYNFRHDDNLKDINFSKIRAFGFEGVNVLRIDIYQHITEIGGQKTNKIISSVKANRNSRNCFDFSFDDNLFTFEFKDAKEHDNIGYELRFYDDEKQQLLHTSEKMCWNRSDEFHRKFLKYNRLYTWDGEATNAIVSVDSDGLNVALFPEEPNEIAGFDLSDVVYPSGLRGQTHVKVEYYDVDDNMKFVAKKVAELKYFQNNDNFQFDMRDENGQPLICGGRTYKVVFSTMDDEPLCWFKYIAGKSLVDQNW